MENSNQEKSFGDFVKESFKEYIFDGGFFQCHKNKNAEYAKRYKDFFINNLVTEYFYDGYILTLKIKTRDNDDNYDIVNKIKDIVLNAFNKEEYKWGNYFEKENISLEESIFEIFLNVRAFVKFFDDLKNDYYNRNDLTKFDFIISAYNKFNSKSKN